MVKPVLDGQQINALRQQIQGQMMEEKLLQFIAKLIHQTRNHKSIYLGASPRASLAIMNASKAIAAMQGRDFVTPEDILKYRYRRYFVTASSCRLIKRWKESQKMK